MPGGFVNLNRIDDQIAEELIGCRVDDVELHARGDLFGAAEGDGGVGNAIDILKFADNAVNIDVGGAIDRAAGRGGVAAGADVVFAEQFAVAGVFGLQRGHLLAAVLVMLGRDGELIFQNGDAVFVFAVLAFAVCRFR